ncbi:MAG: hypothetical protein AB7G37_06285 [Solirubrobacteraceae bacterium]
MLDTVGQTMLGTTAVAYEVTAGVHDIARRLRDGDATIGWLGDDTLSLKLAVPVDWRGEPEGDPVYEVWGVDSAGVDYMVLRWPRADASMLRKLIEGDSRVADPVARVMAHNQALDRDRARRDQDAREERHDKLHHALLKDIGHLEGGLTRRIH